MLKFPYLKSLKTLKLKLSRISQATTPRKPKLVNKNVEEKSTKIINLAGYTILFLVLLDYIFLLVPANLFEPSWTYNISGNLVENVWAFLLGFLLIFYRRDQGLIRPREFAFLSFLSWLTLAIGIIYFLITPLIVANAFRINRSQQNQVTIRIEQQDSQVERYSQQLNEASPEQINNLWQNYQQQAPNQEIASGQQFKENLLSEVKQQQKISQNKLRDRSKKQKIDLFKTTIKWSLGAMISSISFILIWRHTKWTRLGN
ncbi:hypothetical protein Xen7305DRAFT_00052720 [Xenococcus sp. PCC 7305]|uniref:HpsJ-like protein, cyanoexosortase A-associated n=1 Tax=Xenococcus sp. PCC 7305 TaxID=102125 RepID=UPI0002ACF4D8|nr:HpsJ family protein [Xenococcus sp. PCC 7305]ELS05526.1 hypothetical protein Xen7305DRAFT_00052720 [Xenococcus sp. PCC 7305]